MAWAPWVIIANVGNTFSGQFEKLMALMSSYSIFFFRKVYITTLYWDIYIKTLCWDKQWIKFMFFVGKYLLYIKFYYNLLFFIQKYQISYCFGRFWYALPLFLYTTTNKMDAYSRQPPTSMKCHLSLIKVVKK